ncbi:DUF2946 family protein [Aquisalimonas sp.]|uniref:DUF2946 family protein n=1 Tax=Aquisalimonas sp. TaxID=1872621 RepID=UPI0025C4EA0C|nr:DUF2946 family protein [Aquisalimonas sp.]
MDESVRNAIARWPNVPAVYGYIGVNRRGDFLLQGHLVTHARTRGFINRNYGLDAQGRAFFQNGPQRAYADLEVTPWVYRLLDDGSLRTHCEHPVNRLIEAGSTADGEIVLVTEHGPGVLHAQDLDPLAEHLETPQGDLPSAVEALQQGDHNEVYLNLPAGRPRLQTLDPAELPRRFGYALQPEPPPEDSRAAVSSYRPAWRPAAAAV